MEVSPTTEKPKDKDPADPPEETQTHHHHHHHHHHHNKHDDNEGKKLSVDKSYKPDDKEGKKLSVDKSSKSDDSNEERKRSMDKVDGDEEGSVGKSEEIDANASATGLGLNGQINNPLFQMNKPKYNVHSAEKHMRNQLMGILMTPVDVDVELPTTAELRRRRKIELKALKSSERIARATVVAQEMDAADTKKLNKFWADIAQRRADGRIKDPEPSLQVSEVEQSEAEEDDEEEEEDDQDEQTDNVYAEAGPPRDPNKPAVKTTDSQLQVFKLLPLRLS